MKQEFLSSVLLTIFCLLLFSGVYTMVIWAVALTAPNHGDGFTISSNGKYYYENVAQKFTQDQYFWSRPSAIDYNAAGSGGSNKGPFNPDYLAEVQKRIDTFMVHNPGIKKSEIPSDLVTASGSGLDPDISIQGANVQIKRIAAIRHLPEEKVVFIVNKYIEKPFLGIMGPQKVNVLKLNIALDNLK